MIKALIVDDEKIVRKGLISMMPWAKFDMEIVGDVPSGQKALDLMREQEVDLLFTDLIMPEMSGFELIKEVKINHPSVGFVVLTCHEDFSYAKEAIRLGALDYIVKNDLEVEVMDDVLERVAAKYQAFMKGDLRQNGSGSFYGTQARVESAAAGDDSASLDRLSELVFKMRWLFMDREYRELTDFIIRTQPSPDVLIPLFCQFVLENSPLFGPSDMTGAWIARMAAVHSWDSFEEHLAELREGLRGRSACEQYPEEITGGLVKAIRFMHEQDHFDYTQNDLADLANMSRSYFSINFKAVTGKSFSEYSRDLRLARAKKLLLQTNKPIYWIAEQVGFKDERYFSKLFLQYVGELPSEFRNRKMP